MKCFKLFSLLCIALISFASAHSKEVLYKYAKEINFDAMSQTQRISGECAIEDITDFQGYILQKNKNADQWIAIIDKKIENASILSGNGFKNVPEVFSKNKAGNNKALTLIYESQRAGLDRNFLAAYTIYWTKQPSDPNALKLLLPIGKERLAAFKRDAFESTPNLISICWYPTGYRTNLRMFSTIFAGYLNANSQNMELALISYLMFELKFSEEAAKTAYLQIKDIENNLSQ